MPPSSDLITHAGGEVARSEPTFMEVVAAAISNPQVDVAKIDALLQLKERMEARDAEKAFNAAMARLQPQLPAIRKNGKVSYSTTNFSFATYEDIDDAIRPLLCAEGFSLSFNSSVVDGKAVYTGTLAHAQGHSKSASMILPADTSGGKNAIQAVGSTVSYAKRYLVGMLLNIITRGQDDDANSADPITQQQAMDVHQWLDLLALEPPKLAKFWAWIGPPAVSPETIQKQQYDKVATYLKGLIRGAK